MRVIKACYVETKDSCILPLMILPLIENKENKDFKIGVFLGVVGDTSRDYIPVFIANRNDGCKYWANIYHIVLDYFLQNRKLIFDITITKYDFGISIIFTVPCQDKYSEIIWDGIVENLEKSKAFKKTFFLEFKYFYKQQQKILGATYESS